MALRKLPAPQEGHRVETGVVQFGDDWPGVFIRGDDAFHFMLALNQVIAGRTMHADVFSEATVRSLIALLNSSNVQNIPPEER